MRYHACVLFDNNGGFIHCAHTCTCMHTLYLGQSVAEKPSTY